MSFEVFTTAPFERKIKKLFKKYKSLNNDLLKIVEALQLNPTLGTAIGKNCFKIRVSISSKARGKSGGARLITYVKFLNNSIYLLDIYDKSEQESISENELTSLINLINQI